MKEPEMESIRWFEQAKYDLKAARWNAKGDLFAPACFWAQQAAEKATKAFIYSKGERFVIGHSVAELLKKCQKYDKGFKPLLTIGGFLDRFYIPTRYPNGLPGGIPALTYNRKDSTEAIRMAQRILDFISDKLSIVVT